MARTLRSVCLCLGVLLGGCKKNHPASTEPDPPGGVPGLRTGGNGVSPGNPTPPLLSARPALPAGWVEFRHPDGAYTVFLPTQPRPVKGLAFNLRQQVPTGRALMSNHKADTPGLFIGVGAAVYSPELVDGVRAADERKPVSGQNGKRTPVTWAGHSAFEDTSEQPGSTMLRVKRWMWIGNRSYYCSLWGLQAGRPTAEERAAIFDSFSVGN